MASWVSNHLDVRSTWAVATVKDVTRYSQMWGRDRRKGIKFKYLGARSALRSKQRRKSLKSLPVPCFCAASKG